MDSWRPLDLVASWNVDLVVGTYLAFAPQVNGRRLEGWLRRLHSQPPLS
ncbi:MAG TPA: hypothetical protein VK988_03590 [Acidimicrobiales bacterium]|nr:hypothetical protein [Acidimicrobiales bacterium]